VGEPWLPAVEQYRQGLHMKGTHLRFVDYCWRGDRLQRPWPSVVPGHIGGRPEEGRAAVHGFGVHQAHRLYGAANDIDHFSAWHIAGYFMPLQYLLDLVADGAHVIAVGREIR